MQIVLKELAVFYDPLVPKKTLIYRKTASKTVQVNKNIIYTICNSTKKQIITEYVVNRENTCFKITKI